MPNADGDPAQSDLSCLVGAMQNAQSCAERGWKLVRIALIDGQRRHCLELLWRRPDDASSDPAEPPAGSRPSVLKIALPAGQESAETGDS